MEVIVFNNKHALFNQVRLTAYHRVGAVLDHKDTQTILTITSVLSMSIKFKTN